MASNKTFKSLFGILLLLFDNMQPPLLVSQIFVEFCVGFPFETCTCIGSLFSFDQKYILYPQISNILGNFYSSFSRPFIEIRSTLLYYFFTIVGFNKIKILLIFLRVYSKMKWVISI